jgi:hypothetical protein
MTGEIVNINDDEPEESMTLGDAYLRGDGETRMELDAAAAGLIALYEEVDQDNLRLVRTGGEKIRVVSHRGSVEIQLDIYRTGKTYGSWTLRCSPEGHKVIMEHRLPVRYTDDGTFDVCGDPETWELAVEHWRTSPALYLEGLIGKRLARTVAPLLPLPAHIAPDAAL